MRRHGSRHVGMLPGKPLLDRGDAAAYAALSLVLPIYVQALMSFDPIVQKSISEQVAQRLLTMIRSGLLKPDQQLPPERELASMLGVAAGGA